MPPQLAPTIGDRLSDAGVSWAWYAGGWDDAVAGNPAPTFEFHHQPFSYFSRYGEGMPGRQHLQDETRFLTSLTDGTMPAVSFIKPLGIFDEHAGYSAVEAAESHAVELDRSGEGLPVLGAIGNRRHLRRFRRLVRPRRPAPDRPLGTRRPGTGHHRLALGAQGIHRLDAVRPHLDPQVHRVAVESGAHSQPGTRSPGICCPHSISASQQAIEQSQGGRNSPLGSARLTPL